MGDQVHREESVPLRQVDEKFWSPPKMYIQDSEKPKGLMKVETHRFFITFIFHFSLSFSAPCIAGLLGCCAASGALHSAGYPNGAQWKYSLPPSAT